MTGNALLTTEELFPSRGALSFPEKSLSPPQESLSLSFSRPERVAAHEADFGLGIGHTLFT